MVLCENCNNGYKRKTKIIAEYFTVCIFTKASEMRTAKKESWESEHEQASHGPWGSAAYIHFRFSADNFQR